MEVYNTFTFGENEDNEFGTCHRKIYELLHSKKKM